MVSATRREAGRLRSRFVFNPVFNSGNNCGQP
jgi:hypothetical protein